MQYSFDKRPARIEAPPLTREINRSRGLLIGRIRYIVITNEFIYVCTYFGNTDINILISVICNYTYRYSYMYSVTYARSYLTFYYYILIVLCLISKVLKC